MRALGVGRVLALGVCGAYSQSTRSWAQQRTSVVETVGQLDVRRWLALAPDATRPRLTGTCCATRMNSAVAAAASWLPCSSRWKRNHASRFIVTDVSGWPRYISSPAPPTLISPSASSTRDEPGDDREVSSLETVWKSDGMWPKRPLRLGCFPGEGSPARPRPLPLHG